MSNNNKNRSFNLIEKEVSLKNFIKEDHHWYKLMNFSILFAFGLLGALSFLFQNYLNTEFENKKNILFNYINNNLDIPDRQNAIKEINLINDRYKLYNYSNEKDFNLIDLENDFRSVFGDYVYIMAIKNESELDVFNFDLLIRQNGYEYLYDFLEKLNNNNNIFTNPKLGSLVFNYASPLENSSVNISVKLKYSKSENRDKISLN